MSTETPACAPPRCADGSCRQCGNTGRWLDAAPKAPAVVRYCTCALGKAMKREYPNGPMSPKKEATV